MRRLSRSQARRIALAAQGFADPRPNGRVDRRHFRRVINRIGLLQLDSVNVVQRSHYMPVWSRLGLYPIEGLDEYTSHSREMFEYWGHVASLLPVELHRLLRWRMDAVTPGPRTRAMLADHPGYVKSVLAEITEHGPLSVSDLADPGTRTGPWWGHGKGRVALDWLFARGEITAYRTDNFVRVYDLPDRVIPAEHLAVATPTKEEALRELLLLSARHHGVGTATDLADYYRLRVPAVRPILTEMVAAGELEEVSVEGWSRPAYMYPGATLPRGISTSALLTPFDPVVWERDRAERLFDFFYRIEIYVPKPQRVYGYYVMPFLMDERVVARVDLKADRKGGVLLVKGAFTESGVDAGEVAVRLAPELAAMSDWLRLGDVAIRNNGDLAPALGRTIQRT